MEVTAHVARLELAETFTIARSSSDVEDVCVVTLSADGVEAIGEGAPVDYWGETAEGMVAAIEADGAALLGDDPFALEAISGRLAAWDGPQGAKMALDGAAHDLVGKRLGIPVWQLLGLDPVVVPTSFTIGIDTVSGTADKTRRALHRPDGRGFRILKVKVGGEGDLERLRAVRAEAGPDVRIRIDGNEGWTLDGARDLVPELVALGVEFVEQPFPAEDTDSHAALRAHLRAAGAALPIVIDEGVKGLASVAAIAGYADGINIKLAKCGGIREAVRMVHAARALGLQVMLGCMIESELGIAESIQVAPLVDYVDLDGHLLIANAPYTGLRFEDGSVLPSPEPGLGIAAAVIA